MPGVIHEAALPELFSFWRSPRRGGNPGHHRQGGRGRHQPVQQVEKGGEEQGRAGWAVNAADLPPREGHAAPAQDVRRGVVGKGLCQGGFRFSFEFGFIGFAHQAF